MASAPRDNRFWLLFFLAALALLITPRLFLHQSGHFTPVERRRSADDMTLPEVNGGEWRLADHRGQVVLVNYWATWCEPCREELPGLMQVSRDFAPQGLAVVGISLDDGKDATAKVTQFVTQFRIPYAVAFPTATSVYGQREVEIPTTVLIDRHGRIVKTYVGAVSQRDFTTDLNALLAES